MVGSKSMVEIKKVNALLNSEFEMKDLHPTKRILGMDIEIDHAGGVLTLSQSSYIKKILQVFNMVEAKSVSTPIGAHFKLASVKDEEEAVCEVPYCNVVGSTIYAMIRTRPELTYAVGLVNRLMSNLGTVHWSAVQWILKYLNGTHYKKLVFTNGSSFIVEGNPNSDYAGGLERRRSITGYVFTVGANTFSWKSNMQYLVFLSTT